ncbi:MAG TPA: hypothetical protein VH107_08510 [Lacipirellulaceae bacterium]|nr:hypothetical protein [Lacipirellulaceae bacterium]
MASISAQAILNVGGQVKVKCQAMQGVFHHEVGVLIRGSEGSYESLLDAEMVTLDEPLDDGQKPGTLRATVVKVNGVKVLVELPRQVVSGGRRVWIPKTEIQP